MTLPFLLSAALVLAEAMLPSWHLEHEVSIGSEGVEFLSHVSDIALYGDVLYVAQPMERAIKAYAHDGSLIRTIGREGEGPGEYQWIREISFKGDTLFVADGALLRLTLLSPTGRVYDTATYRPDQGVIPVPLQPTPHGTLLSELMPVPEDPYYRQNSSTIGLMTRSGIIADTLVQFDYPHSELIIDLSDRGFRSMRIRQPLNDDPVWSIAPDGSFLAALYRWNRNEKTGDSYTLAIYRVADGVRFLSRSYESRAPSESTISEAEVTILKWLSGAGGSAPRSYMRIAMSRAKEKMYIPEVLPLFRDIQVDSQNRIWLEYYRQYRRSASKAEWLLLDESGAQIARVTKEQGHAPQGSSAFRILAADDDIVWGVSYKQTGEPVLSRYRLVRD